MTTDASCVIDDLAPLHRATLWFFKHGDYRYSDSGESETISCKEEKKTCPFLAGHNARPI
jgi:hypothetical protein